MALQDREKSLKMSEKKLSAGGEAVSRAPIENREKIKKQTRGKRQTRFWGLLLAPFLILTGLLAAPQTRPLLQTQLGLVHSAAPFAPGRFTAGMQKMGFI